jgi:hypothetical protein
MKLSFEILQNSCYVFLLESSYHEKNSGGEACCTNLKYLES